MTGLLSVLAVCVTVVVLVSLKVAERLVSRVDESERCVAVKYWKKGGSDRCRLLTGHTGPHVVKQALVNGRHSDEDHWWDDDPKSKKEGAS